VVRSTPGEGPTEVRVYVEGGGNSHREQRELREGFGKLFARVLGAGCKVSAKPSGGRAQAFKDFKRALKSHPDAHCILLVDSEDVVHDGLGPWDHVRSSKQDKWDRPEGVRDDQLHFMVQAMEAWLIADPDTLEKYYGQGFKKDALPGRRNIENVSKEQLGEALKRATRDTKTKGRYDKCHGFLLIGLVEPEKVRESSPYAARFFDALRAASEALSVTLANRRGGRL